MAISHLTQNRFPLPDQEVNRLIHDDLDAARNVLAVLLGIVGGGTILFALSILLICTFWV